MRKNWHGTNEPCSRYDRAAVVADNLVTLGGREGAARYENGGQPPWKATAARGETDDERNVIVFTG